MKIFEIFIVNFPHLLEVHVRDTEEFLRSQKESMKLHYNLYLYLDYCYLLRCLLFFFTCQAIYGFVQLRNAYFNRFGCSLLESVCKRTYHLSVG